MTLWTSSLSPRKLCSVVVAGVVWLRRWTAWAPGAAAAGLWAHPLQEPLASLSSAAGHASLSEQLPWPPWSALTLCHPVQGGDRSRSAGAGRAVSAEPPDPQALPDGQSGPAAMPTRAFRPSDPRRQAAKAPGTTPRRIELVAVAGGLPSLVQPLGIAAAYLSVGQGGRGERQESAGRPEQGETPRRAEPALRVPISLSAGQASQRGGPGRWTRGAPCWPAQPRSPQPLGCQQLLHSRPWALRAGSGCQLRVVVAVLARLRLLGLGLPLGALNQNGCTRPASAGRMSPGSGAETAGEPHAPHPPLTANRTTGTRHA
jgi:hypothetical protein